MPNLPLIHQEINKCRAFYHQDIYINKCRALLSPGNK